LDLDLVSLILLVFVISDVISNTNMPLLIGPFVLFVLPQPPHSDGRESDSLTEDLPPPSPVLPHQEVVTDDVNLVHRIHWRPFPAVAYLPPLQQYANQQIDGPDHQDRQTCNLAGSVGHYRCPRWYGAVWDKHDWEEEDLPLVQQDRAGSPQSVHSSMPGLKIVPPSPSPPPLRNLLNPIPPHRPEDWQVVVRRDAPDPTLEQMVLWNANILHVPAEGGTARLTYNIRLPAGTGVHVRYHSPFSNGMAEPALHRRPLEEQLTFCIS
jgi:hypothetical protein